MIDQKPIIFLYSAAFTKKQDPEFLTMDVKILKPILPVNRSSLKRFRGMEAPV